MAAQGCPKTAVLGESRTVRHTHIRLQAHSHTSAHMHTTHTLAHTNTDTSTHMHTTHTSAHMTYTHTPHAYMISILMADLQLYLGGRSLLFTPAAKLLLLRGVRLNHCASILSRIFNHRCTVCNIYLNGIQVLLNIGKV